MSMKLTEAQHRCEAAEAELAAARKVEDGELYKKIQDVLDSHSAWIARPSNDVTKAIAIVAGIWGSRYADAAEARAQAAEAALKEASRLAVKHAVQSFAIEREDGAVDFGHYVCGECLAQGDSILVEHEPDCAIRALQTKDTTP